MVGLFANSNLYQATLRVIHTAWHTIPKQEIIKFLIKKYHQSEKPSFIFPKPLLKIFTNLH